MVNMYLIKEGNEIVVYKYLIIVCDIIPSVVPSKSNI